MIASLILTILLLAQDWPEAGTRSENRLMDETGGAQRLSDTRIQTGLENFSISSVEQARAHVWHSDAVHRWLNEGSGTHGGNEAHHLAKQFLSTLAVCLLA